MQISSILSGYADLAALDRWKDGPTGIVDKEVEKPAGQPASAGSAAAIRQIVEQYDVTDISPRELSEMLRMLRQVGALTEEQFQQLALIRLDLDSQNIGPEERVDLIELYTRRIEKAQRDIEDGEEDGSSEPMPEIDLVRQWLAWLDKFAAIRARPEDLGVNRTV